MKINNIGRLTLFWSCAIIIAIIQSSASAQTLVHRYSFSDTDDGAGNIGAGIADSIGGTDWNGTLPNGGDLSTLPNHLLLSASSQQYVQLPVGILSNYTAVTIDCWAQFGTLPAACFLYGFGGTDTNVLSGGLPSGYDYIYCQPKTGFIAITAADPGWQGEQGTAKVGDWSGQTIHVTSVYNPTAGYIELYTNGVLASRNTAVTTQMSAVTNQLNYIARSLYNADSYMDVALDEFRIWNGALNPLDVAANDLSGPDVYPAVSYGSVTNLQLQIGSPIAIGAATAPAIVTAMASGLINPVVINSPSIAITYSSATPGIATVNPTNGIVTGVSSGTVNIIAGYAGIFATQAVQVVSLPTTMIHRYSFNDGTADDSIGTNNGTFYNDSGLSSIANGQLNLNGTDKGDYVDLGSYLISATNIANNALTFEVWATVAPTNGAYTRLWEFGAFQPGGVIGSSSGQNYWSLMPNTANNGGVGRMEISYSGNNLDVNTGNFLGQTNVHIVGVFNPNPSRQFAGLYVNGKLVSSASTGNKTLSSIDDVYSWLGRSLWSGDSALNGSIDEFRIYNGELNRFQIAASDQAGPDTTNFEIGTFTGFTLDAGTMPMPLSSARQAGAYMSFSMVTNVFVTGDANLTLTSDNTNVFTVNAAGVITATGIGTANLNASYNYVVGATTNTYTGSTPITVYRDQPEVLVHRYSFNDANGSTSVADSVGGADWNGTVMSSGINAVPAPGAFTNGMLSLSAANTNYVQLPSGILSNYTAITIEGWVTAQTLPGNSMYYAFGNTDTGGLGTAYIFGSLVRNYTSITAGNYSSEQGISGAAPLPLNQMIHFTAVYDPPAGYISLYTNGVLVGINYQVTDPLSVVSSVEAFIGRSLYNGDPYASLTLDEFRIYDGVLHADEIAASQAIGPDQLLTTNVSLSAATSGGNITLSWPAAAGSFTLQSSTNLTSGVWTTVSPAAQIVGGTQWQVTVPNSGGNKFFRLIR